MDDKDSTYWMLALGASLTLAGALGIGWWRASKPTSPTLPTLAARQAPELVEASVHRGFSYRVELCPWGSAQLYVSTIPKQQVGPVALAQDELAAFVSLEQARSWAQRQIDGRLGPELKVHFTVAKGGGA